MSEKTLPRRLARGNFFHYDEDGRLQRAEIGDVIELTASQCQAFSDLFEAPEVNEARELASEAEKRAAEELDESSDDDATESDPDG